MAPVVSELKDSNSEFEVKVCVTAQHRAMLDQVLDIFDIKPDAISILKPGQDLFDITSALLTKNDKVISETIPDLILVHGDTTTAFTAAVAGFYTNIMVMLRLD